MRGGGGGGGGDNLDYGGGMGQCRGLMTGFIFWEYSASSILCEIC